MKSSELRIGNLVDAINRHHKVHLPYGYVKQVGQIEFFKVHLYEVGKFAIQSIHQVVDIKDLSPIPLTQEWLLNKIDWNGYNTLCINSHFRLDEMGHLYYHGDYTGININYVHQLQNIYFNLKGEELEIKSSAPPLTPQPPEPEL